MKALSDYAALGELRKVDPTNEELTQIDYEIQAYIDRLNARTFMVVSCFTYFRVLEELWKLLDEIETRSKNLNLSELKSVYETIESLEKGMATSNNKVTSLGRELERLRVILQKSDPDYLNRLESGYRDACLHTANAQQIMQLRKLVLKKELKILQCEQEISIKVDLISDNAYEECRKLFDTYRLMCEADLRQMRKPTLSLKNRLAKQYPQLRKRIEEVIAITEQAEHCYTESDKLLGIVGEELLKLAADQALDSSEQQKRNLPGLAERFEQLKTLASSLLHNLKFENRQKGSSAVSGTLSDIRGGLRLRLYTLLVKLQEYERVLVGHCHMFTLTDDLIPQWRTLTPDSRHRSPPCRPKQIQSSVANSRPLSCGSVRTLPIPPKPLPRGSASPPVLPPRVTPSGITSRATDEAPTGSPRSEDLPVFSDAVDQFTELLLHLKTPIDAVDVNKAQVDDLLQQHEEARQKAYEEWHKLESRLSDALARPSLSSVSLGGLKALQTEAKNRYMDWLHDWEQRRGFLVPRQRLLERIAELEHDLGECADRLDHIFGVACRSTATSLTGRLSAESLPQASTGATATTTTPPWSSQLYLRQLEAISAEVLGMRQTVPAQQMFIDHMKEDSTAVYGVQASECMANVEEQWTLYQLKLQRLENALPTLRQGAKLIAEAKAFTATLQSRLSAGHRDPSQFTSLQNEANQLHEKIERLLSSGQLLQQQTGDPSVLPLDWLVNDLQATMAPLQEGSAEAEIIAANLCADEPDTGTLGSPAVVRAVLPAESSLPADRQSAEEDSGTSPVFSPGVFGAPDTIPGSPPSAPAYHMQENRRPTFMNQLSNLTVSPGGSASLQCSFQGLGNRPRATWLFRPQGASPQFPGMALIDESTEAECNHSGARLWIPTVLYRHAGEYTATITNQETGESLSTSAVIQVIPEYKRGLADAYFEIDETPEVERDQCVEFSMNFEGFERIPSRVMWLHDGRPIDSTKWAIAVSPRGTYARSNCLKKVDEGLYTCQVSEFEYGVHLESSAQLHVSCAPVDRAIVNHSAPKVNENSRATVAYEGSPLSLKCPLPASAFDNYDRTGSVQMQWFRDGVQLYDSGPRAPSYFIASNALFQDGNTVWRAGIADGRVTLSTDRVRSVDAGCYSCRVFIGDDAYESSGIIDVSACPQFVEQLSRLKVFAGAAAVLTCRIQPWITESASPTGQQEDGSMQITWYQYNTAITPEIQQKMGIEISQENGICTLRISKVSRRFAGIYRCEARCPQCVCETSCQLLVEQPVAPIILEPVQYAVSRSEPNCIEMRVEYDALPKPEVDWMKDGLLLTPSSKIQISTGNDESTLRILEAKSEDRGKYEAVVRNVAGSARATINFDPSQAMQRSTLTGQEREPKSDATDRDSRPSSTSSSYRVTPRQRPNPAFLIRPQSVTANEGESVTFSCLIRPPATSGGRKIGRVIWRHRGHDLTSSTASTRGQRVQMKANDPVEGAFQLEISGLAQDDRGEYEVSAMDEDGREICNATFSLHVDDEADAASKGDFFIDGPSLPAAVAIASGGRLEVTCHVNGFPPPQVFWLKDGRQVHSGVDANDFQVKQDRIIHQLIIPEAHKHHSGQWEVIGRNAAGLVLSSMTVTVDGRQKVIQSRQEDSSDRHFISVTEPPPYETSPPPPLANPRPGRLSLPSPAVHFEPLEVSLMPQKRTQIYLTHTVLGVPPQFTSLFHDQVCRAGSDVRFKCNIKGVPDPRVMWSFNGETLNNDQPDRIQILRDATLCTLILKAVDRGFTGRYSVTAENATGVATCSALLYVEELIVENKSRVRTDLTSARRTDSGHDAEFSSTQWQIHISPTPESLEYRLPQDGFGPTLLSPTSTVCPEAAPTMRIGHLIQSQHRQEVAPKPRQRIRTCQQEEPSAVKTDSDNSSISEYSNVVIITKTAPEAQSVSRTGTGVADDATPQATNSVDQSHELTTPTQHKHRHITDRLRVEENDEITTISVTSGSPHG
ncbi:hypothetical protein SprV_0100386100 [Sparganum proliferum]